MTRTLFFAAAMAVAGVAQAAGIGVRAGTTGIGADLAWSFAPTLSARLGYSALKWNHDVDTSGTNYDGKLKLSNLSGLLDFSPLGPFRITGGVILNDNKYDLTGRHFSGATLSGTVKPGRSTAPYLGVGYGNVSGTGVNFYTDFGIIFQGSPKASLSCSGLSAGACATLVASEQTRVEDELKRFKYYPVLNIGLTVGF